MVGPAVGTEAEGFGGALQLCASPIGNLGDITYRAVEALRAADLILAEDTRRTAVLLRHYGVPAGARLLSYHDHNERERTPAVVQRLRAGASVVLVTDAGTPMVADPGFHLVRAAIAAGIPVHVLPGPSAALAALTLSGLASHQFAFYGFLPRRGAERTRALREALGRPLTAVWFEAPHRLAATLRAMVAEGFGARQVVVARELTKLHEEVARGPAEDLARRYASEAVRGEITLCVEGAGSGATVADAGDWDAALQRVGELRREGMAVAAAVAGVARDFDLPRRELYRRVVAPGRSGH